MPDVTNTLLTSGSAGGIWGWKGWGAVEALAVTAQLLLIWFAYRQLKEGRDQRLEAQRPFVMVDMDMNIQLKLRIRNIGPTPAYDVKVSFDRPLESMTPDAALERLAHSGIPTLGPGAELIFYFDMMFDRFGSSKPQWFEATVTYHAPPSFKVAEPWIERFIVDIRPYEDSAIPSKTLDDVARALGTMAKRLDKWDERNSLRVTARDGDERDSGRLRRRPLEISHKHYLGRRPVRSRLPQRRS